MNERLKLLGEYEHYAVCVPLKENKFIFEVRSPNIPQPFEISFPGGKIEEIESPYECAVREMREEIGIDAESLLTQLEPLVTPFNTIIYPFLVTVSENTYNLNSCEVSKILEIPVSIFETPKLIANTEVIVVPDESFPFELIPNGRNYNWKKGKYKVYFYEWENYIIWGLTARIAYRAYQFLNGG